MRISSLFNQLLKIMIIVELFTHFNYHNHLFFFHISYLDNQHKQNEDQHENNSEPQITINNA